MASRRDKNVADATAKLGKTIAGALRSWAKDVGADDIASEVVDRVREGLDVVLERAHRATEKARTKTKRTAKKARSSAKKVRRKVRSAATPKTTRKTTTGKKPVRKKR